MNKKEKTIARAIAINHKRQLKFFCKRKNFKNLITTLEHTISLKSESKKFLFDVKVRKLFPGLSQLKEEKKSNWPKESSQLEC